MADTKISALTAYSSGDANDLLPIVDVSDTTMAATGTDKKATIAQVLAAGGVAVGGSSGQLQYNNAGALGGAANLTVGSSGQLNLASQSAPASPANGDTWHDSTQHTQAFRQAGLTIFRPGLIYAQTATVTLSAAATASLVNTSGAVGTVSLPAGFLNVLGRTLRIRANVLLTSPSTSQGNGTYAILLGGNVIATTAAGALGPNNASPGRSASFETLTTVVGTGASGTVDTNGISVGHGTWNGTAAFSVNNGTAAGTTSAGTPVTVDLTAALAIDVQWTFSAAVNSLTLTNLIVEVLA